MLTDIEEEITHLSKMPDSIFELYLDKLHKANLLTREAVKRIYEVESKQKNFVPSNSGKSPSGSTVSRDFAGTLHVKNRSSIDSPLDPTSPINNIKKQKELKRGTGTSPKDDLSAIDSLTLRTPRSPNALEFGTSMKNSYEVSELAISQYSVASQDFEGLDYDDDQKDQSVRDDPFLPIDESKEDDSEDPEDLDIGKRDVTGLAQELQNAENMYAKKPRKVRKAKIDPEIVMEGLDIKKSGKTSVDKSSNSSKHRSFANPSTKENQDDYFV